MRAILGHDDVGRRDVAVDNAVLVKLLHGFANLVDKLHGHIRRKRPFSSAICASVLPGT